MTIPEELFCIFREKLDSLMSESRGEFFKKLEPDVVLLMHSKSIMYSVNLANLINSRLVDVYAIPHPGDATLTIVVKRDFAMTALTLGELPK